MIERKSKPLNKDNNMNLRDISGRLNLQYKIVKGIKKDEYIVHMIIEGDSVGFFPHTRPPYDEEIDEIKEREYQKYYSEMLKEYMSKRENIFKT